ncbi:MAG TPA: succinate dehydrogenase assembly factor 2 [Rhodocyclaceae bacterium]
MVDAKRARIGKLKWHCRRALLELDLVFQRFWARQGDDLDAEMEQALERLLALEDHELWELVNGKASTDDPQLRSLIELLQKA